MNIVKEHLDELNAVLKVTVAEADYTQKVEDAIKQVKKQIAMPGFRPGMVPTSLIKKKHGKSILVDEINKLLNDELNKYIVDNKLEVLGQPLPKENTDLTIDWDSQKEFEFSYDLAIAPKIDLSFLSNEKINFYNIIVDDKTIDSTIDNLRNRNGKNETAEVVTENCLLFISFTELENGTPKEGTANKTSVISLKETGEDFSKLLLNKKKDDSITIIPSQWVNKNHELDHAFAFAIDNETLKGVSFELKINSINVITPAELNQDFYDKIYGVGNTEGIESFRAKVKEELTNLYKTESEKHFSHGVTHLLMDKLNLSLPDTFLKRWIKLVNDKPVTDEQLEKEYPSYANDLRLQLVEDKITKENNIAVSKEETEHYIKALVTDNFIQYGQEPDEALISSTVQQVLKNKEEFKKIYSKLFADKLRAFYLTKLLVTYQEITAEDFSKKIEEHYKHHHNH